MTPSPRSLQRSPWSGNALASQTPTTPVSNAPTSTRRSPGHPADTNRLDAVTLSLLVGAEVDDADRDRLKHMLPPQIREATIASVARHIEATATDGPLTVVFEDLHWADPASIALVERLLAATDRVPLLVLALFRPRRDEPAWSIHETAHREYPHRYTSVQLKPLTTGQSQDLIANLLKVEGLHTTVREAILNKAEGNPFFVEEVVRSLIDNGTHPCRRRSLRR